VLLNSFNIVFAGVVPLSGKFSEAEVARLDAAIEKYRSVSKYLNVYFQIQYWFIGSPISRG
jgi:hypothetical protein